MTEKENEHGLEGIKAVEVDDIYKSMMLWIHEKDNLEEATPEDLFSRLIT